MRAAHVLIGTKDKPEPGQNPAQAKDLPESQKLEKKKLADEKKRKEATDLKNRLANAKKTEANNLRNKVPSKLNNNKPLHQRWQ